MVHALALLAVPIALASPAAAALGRSPSSGASAPGAEGEGAFLVERVTTAVPFPRGLQLVDGKLYVLCRGRVREYGGVSADVVDQAGSIYVVDPTIAEPADASEVSEAVRANATLLAVPTAPPFRLWDRAAQPPSADRVTDRPYCGLSWHAPTQSFYICAFSGIDKPEGSPDGNFSKNLSDAILRYDLRTSAWHEVERHDIDKGGIYPHQDPALGKPPHGWLNGPDNCLAIGDWLYAVSKDNSRLVRYDLQPLTQDAQAGAPQSALVFGEGLELEGLGWTPLKGHSALAFRDGWLYVAFRTSSEIVRIRLDAALLPVEPLRGQLVARFDPYDPRTKASANLTDMCFGPDGALYVVSAKPARVHRFVPDPHAVYDARGGASPAYLDFAALTGNAKMKSENVLVDAQGRVYVTSGDAYDFQAGAGGVVYRATARGR